MKNLKICLAQVNVTVGDIKGNTQKIITSAKEAVENKADLIIFPEMAVTGYPPEDLLLKKRFIAGNMAAIREVASKTGNACVVAGFIKSARSGVYNSAAIMRNKKIEAVYDKMELPNYGVFDEKRYFTAGSKNTIVKIKGVRFGISICEDVWQENREIAKLKGRIDWLINISASPYHMEKWKERAEIFKKRAKKLNAGIIYVNLVGGQDELVFDGHSVVTDKKGNIIKQAAQFREENFYFELPAGSKEKDSFKALDKNNEVYGALVLGTRDYVRKNGFQKAVIGLSGGIDSALVAVVAADALGASNVNLIFMPTQFSSQESYDDAQALCKNLGIKLKVINIQQIFELYLATLSEHFEGRARDIAEENLQARIRGNIIMAFSNKFGYMALTTGNKSEMSTGYATLYGDMAGGFAVIKDVPKTLVYKISEARNEKAGKELIPRNIFTKAPTAELRENQKDQDTLPPYDLLDNIIEDYIEKDRVYSDLKNKYDPETLKRVIRMIDFSEYKRRQAPPGVKITPKAFGRDRRVPITNKYRE
jgi:NAD+ synthase (glutamine-hydrolysing)